MTVKLGENKYSIFIGKEVKIWKTINGKDIFRQGIVLNAFNDGLIIDDRKEGVKFLGENLIDSIDVVSEAKRW